MCCNGMFGYIYSFGFELYVKFIMDSSILKKGFIIFYQDFEFVENYIESFKLSQLIVGNEFFI